MRNITVILQQIIINAAYRIENYSTANYKIPHNAVMLHRTLYSNLRKILKTMKQTFKLYCISKLIIIEYVQWRKWRKLK